MSQPSSKSRELLDALKKAHASVRECLDEMKRITSREKVNRLELTNARFRISKASLGRRMTFNAACNAIATDAAARQKAVISNLRRLDNEMGSKSASHVAHWTAERVESDWKGYCSASHKLRAEMAEQLATQEALLWPLLEAGGRGQGMARLQEEAISRD